MIPKFPNFKKLELTDKAAVTHYTKSQKPYSDFNFTNLWAWDTLQSRLISELHGNLVILFTDYRTNEASLSFIGTNLIPETATVLLTAAPEFGLPDALIFVPEEIVGALPPSEFKVVEDTSNHDYIFSTEQIAESSGGRYKSKRHAAKKFATNNPTARFAITEQTADSFRNDILHVLATWERNKQSAAKDYELTYETIALNRLLDTISFHDVMVTSVYINNAIIGFSIDEILENGYALSHFIKADTTYAGIYEFLNQQTAAILVQQGIQFWNWEQDLNLENLRKIKLSYRPTHYLKKFKVSPNMTHIKK